MKFPWFSNIALTPEDVGFKSVSTLKALLADDITTKPGVIHHRTLTGDFEGLARSMVELAAEGHDGRWPSRAVARNEVWNEFNAGQLSTFANDYKKTLPAAQNRALEEIITDLKSLEDMDCIYRSDGYTARPKLRVMRAFEKIIEDYHLDEENRILIPYTDPPTKGLAGQPPQSEITRGKAKNLIGKPELDIFNFQAGCLHRIAGYLAHNQEPCWHSTPRNLSSKKAHLLLLASESPQP